MKIVVFLKVGYQPALPCETQHTNHSKQLKGRGEAAVNSSPVSELPALLCTNPDFQAWSGY